MPHGTKIIYKTGCRDLRPKRLGTTVVEDLFLDNLDNENGENADENESSEENGGTNRTGNYFLT